MAAFWFGGPEPVSIESFPFCLVYFQCTTRDAPAACVCVLCMGVVWLVPGPVAWQRVGHCRKWTVAAFPACISSTSRCTAPAATDLSTPGCLHLPTEGACMLSRAT